jgi:hypothetical protein
MEFVLADSICVVDQDGRAHNLETNVARGYPTCIPRPARDGRLAIVGSGPSLRDFLPELRDYTEVWAINGAYNFLVESGITPQGFFAVDPLPGLADYLDNPQPETTFYIAATCDPSVFEKVAHCKIGMWFPEQEFNRAPEGQPIIRGGTTALTRAPYLADRLGWRDITIFGADSSFDGRRYVYPDGTYQTDSLAEVNYVRAVPDGPVFVTEQGLMKQVAQLGVLATVFQGRLKFKCGGLLEAFLSAPMKDIVEGEIVDHAHAS